MSTGAVEPTELYPVPVDSELFLGCDPVLFNKFRNYHFRNPTTFVLFLRYWQELLDSGHERGSTWLIVNRIRWDAVITRDDAFEFACSNDFNALYARLAMHYRPEHEEFFAIKRFKPSRTHNQRDLDDYGPGFEDRFEQEYGVRLPFYQQRFPANPPSTPREEP